MIWKLTDNKDWTSLEQQFQWVRDMGDTPQHHLHHGEGNVAIHTRMVLEALQQQSAYHDLSPQEQEILWAAALLHDVEKRSTSVDEGEGRITSKGHAKRGEYTVRTVLYKEISTPFSIREAIAALVRYHGLPIWFMDREDPMKRVCEASLRVDTRLLRILTIADIQGRICNDKSELMESVELFEMFCREHGCWGKARTFATANARFHYFHSEDSYIDYIPFEQFKCEVTMLSGLPGMGKDHYISTLSPDIPVISLDALRRKHKYNPTDKSATGKVVQEAKEEARNFLRNGQSFVWNATNISQQIRSQLIDLFVSYGAKVKVVYIEKPYEVWRKQNREREFAVPENVLDTMLAKLNIPQLTEAHEVEYLVE